MLSRRIINKLNDVALPLMIVRGAIVGLNFAVMLVMAHALGLARFGELVHLWALSVVASTVVAAGGPVTLLRAPAGRSMRGGWVVVLLQPALLTGLGVLVMSPLWSGIAWLEVFMLAFAISVSQAVASVLRVWGSTVVSMLLRDAAPIAAFGLVVIAGAGSGAVLVQTACLILTVTVFLLCWGYRRFHPMSGDQLVRTGQGSLWVSSVLGTLVSQLDLVVAGVFLPAELFGLYALLRRVANLVALPVSVATWVSAGPVADALRRHDLDDLARASASGSRIAWWPAIALFGCGAVGVILMPFWRVAGGGHDASLVFAVLLAGALGQAYWASGFTVANLSARPVFAVQARSLSVLIYGAIALWGGAWGGPLFHAVAYAGAASLGSLYLWYRLWLLLGVDTSARVLRRRQVVVA